MNQPISDLSIIERVLEGETSCYDELVLRHKDYAYTIALKILNNTMDAEEVAHDAFIKAFKSLKYFNQKAKFTTWFYRIVFNTAISHKRKISKHVTDLNEATNSIHDGNQPDSELETEQRIKYLNTALAKMLPIDAGIITMFYMKQLSLEEIGKITSIKASSVKVKLFRARKRLAHELQLLLHEEVYELL